MYKLLKNNIGCKFYEIIDNMYSLCQSAIKVNNEYSQFFNLERGVKQGDSQSPSLFNCYINDLHKIFDKSCDPLKLEDSFIYSLSFADDLVLVSSTHKGLQTALNQLEAYCNDWQLTVNVKKTKVMVFQNKYNNEPSFYYKNQVILETSEYNFLGNIIDFKGKCERSIQELTKKGLKALFALKSSFSNFQSLPVNLSCKLFDLLIRPILLYNCEIWFMEEYLPIIRAKDRANRNGNICDDLTLADISSFEKMHSRYCKSILGLKNGMQYLVQDRTWKITN